MKTLFQLNHRVRKFLTQTFKHGIEDHYKKVNGSNCSRSLSFCRDLAFLPHLLSVKTSWKDITVQDFSVAFNIDGSLLLNDDSFVCRIYKIPYFSPHASGISVLDFLTIDSTFVKTCLLVSSKFPPGTWEEPPSTE